MQELINYWITLVRQTRMYGNCYVKVAFRNNVPDGHIDGRDVTFTYGAFGRSKKKKKAWCNYVDDGKPVPSMLLSSIRANV